MTSLLRFLIGLLAGISLGTIVGVFFGCYVHSRNHGGPVVPTITEAARSRHDEAILRSLNRMHGSKRSPKSFTEIMRDEGWEPNLRRGTWRGKDSTAAVETPPGAGEHH
jgi:hypothetical protein